MYYTGYSLMLEIKTSDNKTKAMWKICNEIRNEGSFKNTTSKSPQETADDYNELLVQLIPNMMKNLNNSKFACNIETNTSFYVKPFTIEEIVEIFRKLKSNSNSGIGEIPVKIVQLSVDAISSILCHIVKVWGVS